MKLTEKLTQHKQMSRKEAEEIGSKLADTYFLISMMATPKPINGLTATNEEWKQHTHETEIAAAYTDLLITTNRYFYRKRRTQKMKAELIEAISYAEKVGATIY